MTWAPCASGAMVNNFQANFIIQKLQRAFSVVTLNGSRPPRPSPDPKPGVRGPGPKQGLESIFGLNCETKQKIYKTKVVGKVCFIGGRIIFLGP